jgi:acyl-[acyl-carrier-protein]-phospholipid O-acyltransferase/long-chain-fatty-acid--[acyl-carrier-protein] ligase
MAVAEMAGEPLSNRQLLTATLLFSRRIKHASPEQNLGIVLPPGAGGIIANLSSWLLGKTVVNLNYTASSSSLSSALEQADIKSVYTSRRFLDKLKDRGIDLYPVLGESSIYYMEDIKQGINKTEKLLTYIMLCVLPDRIIESVFSRNVDPDATAAILFSSGSEGQPKGVQLSHKNLLINVKQVSSVLNAHEDDRVMGTLPIFHAFGLTAATLLPVMEGIPVICHADPTDVGSIAKLIAKYKGTLLFATSTFLRLYNNNRRVDPVLLSTLRLVIAGAEKLSADVAEKFKLKFGKDVFEGFGATETAPVAAVNLPDKLDLKSLKVISGGKRGTVGLPLPGTSFRIVDVQSLAQLATGEEGLVLISGPQVMQGYLNDSERTHAAIVEIDGVRWYKTGDKGRLDEEGYLTIVDRFSRFAKIAGEMVSLAAVEDAVEKVIDDESVEFAAVALPDDKKGERILLLVSYGNDLNFDTGSIRRSLIEKKCNPLMIPAQILDVEQVPRLGSGKTDFSSAKSLAQELVDSS